MKILALNGSHRGEAGYTQWLLDKLAEGAREEGAEFETVVLAKQKIKSCTGCETCQTTPQKHHCIFDQEDDVRAVFTKMEQADILIYATPVYIFNVSSLMKTFLERLNSLGDSELLLTESGLFFKHIGKAVYAKPFVVLTCCGNVEHETVKNVFSYFETVSRFFDAPIVGKLARKSVGMLESAKTGFKEQKPIISDVINAYIQAGRELATQGKIAAGTQKRANRHILGIPFLDLLMKFRLLKQIAIKQTRQRPKAEEKKK